MMDIMNTIEIDLSGLLVCYLLLNNERKVRMEKTKPYLCKGLCK